MQITLTGVGKAYGPVLALDDLDLTIEPGEVVALLGPNGAGKSTTIDLLLGLSTPDRGTTIALEWTSARTSSVA